MIPVLRPYQVDAVDRARVVLRKKNSVLVVAPTASGKTVLAAEIVRSAESKGLHVAFLAHRTELIDQTVEKLYRFGVVAGVIMASDPRYYPLAKVQVCSVPTLARRLKDVGTVAGALKQGPPPAQILIYDEAHHVAANSNRAIVDYYRKRYNAKVIGLTATPWRADGLGLADFFDEEVLVCRPEELITNGALVDYDAFAFDAPDLHEVKMTAGDYNQKQLGEVVARTATRAGNIVEEYLDRAKGRRAMLFPVDIADSRRLCDEFEAAGVRTAHVDWSTPKDERRESIAKFVRGDVLILSSVNALTEGFDVPLAEVAILARPTASLTLHIQMIGRALRVVPCECGEEYVPKTRACKCGTPWRKTRALIMDFSANLMRHGLPDDEDRDYSMKATSQKIKQMQTCPICNVVFAGLKSEWTHERAAAEAYAVSTGPDTDVQAAKSKGINPAVLARALVRLRMGLLKTQMEWVMGVTQTVEAKVCPNCGEILGAPDTSGGMGAAREPLKECEAHEILSKEEIRDRRTKELDARLRGHLTEAQMTRADRAPPDARKAEYSRLLKVQAERKYKANYASMRYRATFGEWPRWKVEAMANVPPAADPFFEEAPPDAPMPDAPPPWLEVQ